MDRVNRQEIGCAAWFAGIVDGEGTISLQISNRANRSQTIRAVPKLLVANTDEGIILRCIECLEVIGVGYYRRLDRKPAGRVVGVEVKQFLPVTIIEVSGFKRLRTLLRAIEPWLAGSKLERTQLLLKFIEGRIGRVEASKTAQNLTYNQEDVDNVMAFLALTRTKKLDHIAKILNDHTREARIGARKSYCRKRQQENKDLYNANRRAKRRESRNGLTS